MFEALARGPMMGQFPAPYAGRMMDGGLGLHPLAIVLCVLAIVVITALITWAIARRRPNSGAVHMPPSTSDEALVIARTRLARGEIDAEQYATIAAALKP